MNQFNERSTDMLYYLFKKNSWCSLAELSEMTGYSKSTIWRDITYLNNELPPGWSIEKNDLLGARLIKSNRGTLEGIWAYLKKENTYFKTLEFILLNNGVTVSEIAEKVHISRSSVYRQLEYIQEVVEAEGIQLTKSPFKLIGDERKIRRIFMQYLEVNGADFQVDLTKFQYDEFQSTLLQLTYENHISTHIGSIQRLGFIMYISNIRISNGCTVLFSNEVLEEFQNSVYFEIAKKMYRFMEKCPTREQQVQETLFFSIYLMSVEKPFNRTQELNSVRIQWKQNPNDPQLVFLKNLSDHLQFDITQDDKFLYKFISTVRLTKFDTLFQTETRINTVLPFLPYVESNSLFKLIEELTKYLDSPTMSFGKLEVLEIFLLVQAALLRKRNQTTIMTALITRSYVEKDYIREFLSYHFGHQLTIMSFDYTDIELIKRHNEIDLVIGTLKGNYSIDYIPVLKVSTFPTASEILRIKNFINEYLQKRFLFSKDILFQFQDDIET